MRAESVCPYLRVDRRSQHAARSAAIDNAVVLEEEEDEMIERRCIGAGLYGRLVLPEPFRVVGYIPAASVCLAAELFPVIPIVWCAELCGYAPQKTDSKKAPQANMPPNGGVMGGPPQQGGVAPPGGAAGGGGPGGVVPTGAGGAGAGGQAPTDPMMALRSMATQGGATAGGGGPPVQAAPGQLMDGSQQSQGGPGLNPLAMQQPRCVPRGNVKTLPDRRLAGLLEGPELVTKAGAAQGSGPAQQKGSRFSTIIE
ncbi:hypothetical protein HPB51_001513 [Rhipicephalus microplus]|uniref:Uncharacterized protein n=1 Tax=Rhipicephalus microplus TaxID=6941 RepID=A0A9J6EW34_RHIMP|nr:hypothetical protein HPB51_001513 [Rhipicephalus microplus]